MVPGKLFKTLLIILISFFSSSIFATTFYVSLTGDDENIGNELHPFRTIKFGVSVLLSGDTLIIKSGDYGNEHDIFMDVSGTEGAPITILAEVEGGVILHGLRDHNFPDGGGVCFDFFEASYIVIDGIKFVDFNDPLLFTGFDEENIIHNLLVKNCIFYDNGGQGIAFWMTKDVEVINCSFITHVQDVGCPPPGEQNAIQDYGVAFYHSENMLVEDCYFFGPHNQSLSFKEACHNGMVRRNIFEGAGYTAIYLGQNKLEEGRQACSNLTAEYNIVRPGLGLYNYMKSPIRIDNVENAIVRYNYFEGADFTNNIQAVTIWNDVRGVIDIHDNIIAHGVINEEGGAFGILWSLEPGAATLNIKNNTVFCAKRDLYGDLTPSERKFENNIICSVNEVYFPENNFAEDPGFILGLPIQHTYYDEFTVFSFDDYYDQLTYPFRLTAGNPNANYGFQFENPVSTEYYPLTVVDGIEGQGYYEEGTQVNITADNPPIGYSFSNWTVSGEGTIEDIYSSSTQFLTSASATIITANYILNGTPVISLNVESGLGSGDYEGGAIVDISADQAADGYHFVGWTTESEGVFGDVQMMNTTFETPIENSTITVTAEYAEMPPVHIPGSYYVSLNGSDLNDGSLSNPFRTIKYGISTLVPGDELIIQDGNYGNEDNMFYSLSGTSADPIIIRAENPGNVFLNGTRDHFLVNGGGYGMSFDQSSYITIEGIHFTDYSEAVYFQSLYEDNKANHVTINNCVFDNNGGVGAGFWMMDDIIITNNSFITGVPDGGYPPPGEQNAIQDYGTNFYHSDNILVENNYFTGPHNQAISFKEGCHNGLVRRNIIEGVGYTGIYLGQNKLEDGRLPCSDLTAEYNIIRPREGIYNYIKSPLRIDNVINAIVRYNYLEGWDLTDNTSAINIFGDARGAIEIYDNIMAFGIENENSCGVYKSWVLDANLLTIDIHHNTFFNVFKDISGDLSDDAYDVEKNLSYLCIHSEFGIDNFYGDPPFIDGNPVQLDFYTEPTEHIFDEYYWELISPFRLAVGSTATSYGYQFESTLPVQNLIDLNVDLTDENQVKISWSTIMEINNKGFEIQRSRDGLNWSKIAWVKGKGNSTSSACYMIFDDNPNDGINYYRYKQIDFDGAFIYSKIAFIDFQRLGISVYPNPFDNILIVKTQNRIKNINLKYNIINSKGQITQSGKVENKIISTENLMPGLFYFIISTENGVMVSSKKMLKL